MRFCEILRDLINEYGITQTELAEKLDIKPSQISEWLKEKSKPGYDNLRNFSVKMNVSAGYLLGLEDDIGAPIVAPMGEKLTTSERELLADFRKLSPYLQGIAMNTVRGLTGAGAGDLHKKA